MVDMLTTPCSCPLKTIRLVIIAYLLTCAVQMYAALSSRHFSMRDAHRHCAFRNTRFAKVADTKPHRDSRYLAAPPPTLGAF
jgi:hypothetical protein